MRLGLLIVFLFNFSYAKDMKHKIQSLIELREESLAATDDTNSESENNLRSMRNDTSTIWFDDLEGDITGWSIGQGWSHSEQSSYSPTNSFHMDDDNFDLMSEVISPTITLPNLSSEFEILKMNFALWADLPDFDGSGDNYLEDYYWVDIANLSDVPVYFHQSAEDSYDGQNWWCADPALSGYLDAWIQVLNTPTITVPDGGKLSTMMKWGIEDPSGAAVTGTCTDGWDAANVRISTDGGNTWGLLVGNDPYDFNYAYGFIYNDADYDCGGSLENVAAGWGGQSDWHQVEFDLSSYAGQDVIIQFAFGSDPSYSTPDDNTIPGFRVDNITVTDGSGNVVFFDNADDQVQMTPANSFEFSWVQLFYDYGDITRPGSLGWEVYPPGAPFNGNSQLDISEYAGADIKIRLTGRMDENDDGGSGEGLFFDDIHVWKVSVNSLPPVTNLNSVAGNAQVVVSWDLPPSEQYDNDEVYYHSNSADNAYYWSIPNEIRFGSLFTIPFGATTFTIHNARFGAEHNDPTVTDIPTVIEGYNVSPTGIAETTPLYSLNATLTSGDLSQVDIPDWTFEGSFLISMQADSNVSMYVDETAQTFYSYFRSDDFGFTGWYELVEDGGGTGEWLISVNVSTTGEIIEPEFNVYRSVDGGGFNPTFNGMGLSTNEYIDNFVSNGTQYCYQVEAVYDGEPSSLAGPTCSVPEAQTIYEIAYDDGTEETSINAGNMNSLCVKFTPEAYPVDLYRVSFYCVGNENGVQFVNVWDDDGENGGPGTLLLPNFPTTFTGGIWTPVSLSQFGVVISDGSFYVGWTELSQVPVGVDADNPSTNSYIDIGFGSGFEPFGTYFEGALMIRAEVDSVNALNVVENIDATIPSSFVLEQNFPNPFNPVTNISFGLVTSGLTSIDLFDVNGKKVRQLMNQQLSAGRHSYRLNSSELSSGMYFYTINVEGSSGRLLFSETKKMILMK